MGIALVEEKTKLFSVWLRVIARVFAVALLSLAATTALAQTQVESSPSQQFVPTPSQDDATLTAQVIPDTTVAHAAIELWEANPDAEIVVPEEEINNVIAAEEAHTRGEPEAVAPSEPAPQQQELTLEDPHGPIQVISPDNLNAVLLLASYTTTTALYILSNDYSWLQHAALVSANIGYLTFVDSRFGLWGRFMQKGGHAAVAIAKWAGSINSKNRDKAKAQEKKVGTLGQIVTHGTLTFLYYLGFRAAAIFDPNVGHWLSSLLTWTQQSQVVEFSSMAFVTGLGWTLLQLEWSSLKNQKLAPIGRQAYTTLSNVRGALVGTFVPGLMGAISRKSLEAIAGYAIPFVVSGLAGWASYLTVLIRGNAALVKNPTLQKAITNFERMTTWIDAKLETVQKVRIGIGNLKSRCAAILAGPQAVGE